MEVIHFLEKMNPANSIAFAALKHLRVWNIGTNNNFHNQNSCDHKLFDIKAEVKKSHLQAEKASIKEKTDKLERQLEKKTRTFKKFL